MASEANAPAWALTACFAMALLAGCARRRLRRRDRCRRQHRDHLVAQRQQRPAQGLLGRRSPRRTRRSNPDVKIEITRAPERGPAHPAPRRAAVQRPARPLPAVGRRRDRRAGRERASSWTSPTRSPRPIESVGGSAAGLAGRRQAPTACRGPSAWSGSGTTRPCSTQAGITDTARDARRVLRRGRQAQGRRHRPDRRRRRRQVARRALLVQLRACASAARTSWSRPARTSTSPTRASSRPART